MKKKRHYFITHENMRYYLVTSETEIFMTGPRERLGNKEMRRSRYYYKIYSHIQIKI